MLSAHAPEQDDECASRALTGVNSACAPETPGRRRKSVPARAAGPGDAQPGVRFRVAQGAAHVGGEDAHGAEQHAEPWLHAFGYDLVARRRAEEWGAAESPPSMTPRPKAAGRSCASESGSSDDESPLGAPGAAQAYGGSLAHLVPNAVLATTSRRVSTAGPAPGCACASCGCTVTPYWRDGWDARVMLCNACGLRFQKFARRCPACAYIPRKEDAHGALCVRCSAPWA